MENSHAVLHQLSERASRYSTHLDGCVRRNLGRDPLRGSNAFVYRGTLIPDGSEVAIKTFRCTLSGTEDGLKHIFREVHTWSKLRHENIVPMLGFSTEFDSTVSIISEWMPLGNAHEYVQHKEHDPRPLLEDLASGLYYLHGHELGPVVHGALKGFDVMVSSDCRALLTDFGLSTLNTSTCSMSVDPKRGISLHWAAPELLNDFPASMAGDVWAFGMTTLELFTRAIPFSDCCNVVSVIHRIMGGKLPPRPVDESTQFRMTDAWWEICTSCWERNPSSRPTMKDIIEKVKVAIYPTGAALVPQRPLPVKRDCYLPDTKPQPQVMELSSMLHFCKKASAYGILLNGRIKRDSGRIPMRGSTAAVTQGTLAPGGTKVAIKAFYWTGSGTEDELKRILREVHTWSKLHHDNIVPMLGISTDFDSTISIISEWMPLGNAHTYVKNTENDPRPLLRDIANGLYYLHSHELGPVVHGDLKGLNVLVSGDRRALLTDFGYSTLNISTFSMTVDTICGGTPHWMAPELLDGRQVSTASDVWAFGMTILELFTREPPFRNCHNDTVLYRLSQRKLPPRPSEDSTQFRLTNVWWEICISCWERIPSSRPTMKEILAKLEVTASQVTSTYPEASGSACPISTEGWSHLTPKNHEVARKDTAVAQASEDITLIKIVPEYPDSVADSSKTPFNTEFFTCLVTQASIMSDLNDNCVLNLATLDESDYVGLEKPNVEGDSLSRGPANISRLVGLPPHFERLISQSESTSEDIPQGANILKANTKDIDFALMESTGSGENCLIGKGKGGVTQAKGQGTGKETAEEFRRQYPEVMAQLESSLSEVPALKVSLKDRFNAKVRAVWKSSQRRQTRFA